MRTMPIAAVTTAAGAAVLAAILVTAPAPADSGTPRPVLELIKDRTVTSYEWRQTRREIRDEVEHARDVKRRAALTPLVEDGTITASDLDTIIDAHGRSGIARLRAGRDITREQSRAIRDALRGRETIARSAAIDTAMTDLVADGTLTQTQADAVEAALVAGAA